MANTPLAASPSPIVASVMGYINTGSLPYDYEDFGLSRSELIAKFAETGEHEHYLRKDWLAANPAGERVDPNYWDWVMAQIAQDDEDY